MYLDAPTIASDHESKQQILKLNSKATASSVESSIDSLFEETSKTDEDTRSLGNTVEEEEEDFDSISSNKSLKLNEDSEVEDDDEKSNETLNNISNSKMKTFSNNNIYIPVDNEQSDKDVKDLDIEKEFEDYLNDENDDANDLNHNLAMQNDDNHRMKYAKLKELENFEFTLENVELLRQMGVEKYGFINKKFRRKAWPLLILYKNTSKENLNALFTKNSNTSKIICTFHVNDLNNFENLKLF